MGRIGAPYDTATIHFCFSSFYNTSIFPFISQSDIVPTNRHFDSWLSSEFCCLLVLLMTLFAKSQEAASKSLS